ncbi:GCN5 family acetyltransferase [Sphingomonas sp. Leaf33]|uniref:GNAT family N-acetyltransferase n=1 Tax=Sphingomonas sp. Leaf33 TaxID=1736215 RepID=UPI0006F443A2|nr:GNAT family N-acetyltransferase [Sphingomonas sp. Leaf33]KQN26200.1 GCN5 family acetyltransferase [Sphingomonas sp. Leaf33]
MWNPLAIRGTSFAELTHLHPVIERAYRGETARRGWTHEADLLNGPRTSFDVLTAILGDSRQRLLSAWLGARAVGCVAVADRGRGLAYLGQLCVEPELQAAGIGRRLIVAAERTAAAAFGADRIEMTVIESRAELIAYYLRRGYRVTGETRDFPIPLDPPLFMTVLEKPLPVLARG